MKLKQDFITKDRYGIKSPYKMTPKGICIHNTANDAPAKNEIAYMKRNNEQTSFHVAVDEVEAIQAIPFTRNAWHATEGQYGKGNRNYIALEICRSTGDLETFKQAERNAVKVIVQIMKEFKFTLKDIKQHNDFHKKNCPHKTRELGWKRFLDMIEEELTGKEKKETKPTKPKTNLVVDGLWGRETNKALQRHFGTIVDGTISKPSMVIKEIQKVVGARVDGYLGKETITKMQKHLGTIQDGVISRPSMMVKQMQRNLNKGKF